MILVTCAMPEERPSGSFPASCTLVQTGIGKVLAVSRVADGPQKQTHAQFLERIRQRGPDYSEAVRELLDRWPDGIPAPSIPG